MDNLKILKRIIYIGLIVNIIIVTLYFTTKTQNIVIVKPTTNNVIIFGLFFLFLAYLIEKKEFKLPYTSLNFPIVLRILYFVFSAAVIAPRIFMPYAVEEISLFLSYFLAVILIVFAVDTEKKLRAFLIVYFIVYALTIIYGGMQLLNMDPIPWGMDGVFVSTFGNKNFFAGYLIMAMFVYFGHAMGTKDSFEKFLCVLFNIIAVYMVYMSFNRSSLWIGMPIGFIVFIALQLIYGKLKWVVNSLNKFLIFIIALIIIIGAAWIGIGERGRNSFYSVLSPTAGTTNRVRIVMWTGATKLMAENPPFGQGIGVFQLGFGRGRPPWYHRYGVSHNTRHAHNEFMEVLYEEGLIGFGLFLFFLFVYFYDRIKQFKIKNDYYTNLNIGFIAAVCACLGDNLFGVNSRWTATAVNMYYIIGLSLAAYAVSANLNNRKPKIKKIPTNNNPLKYIAYLIFIVVWVSISHYCWRIYKAEIYLKEGERYLNSAQGAHKQQILDYAKEHFEKAIEQNPFELSTYYKMGYIYLEKSELQNALDQYYYLIDNLAPNYAQIHSNTGVIYLQMGKQNEAIYEFEWATRLESNINNHERLMISYLNKGELNKAYSHALYVPYLAYDNYLDRLRFKKRNQIWAPSSFQDQINRTEEAMRNYSYAYSQMSKINNEMKRDRAGAHSLDVSLIWNPINFDALFIKGINAINSGNQEKAYQMFEKYVLETDTNHLRPLQRQSYSQYTGNIINYLAQKASSDIKLQFDPDFIKALTIAWHKHGNKQRAAELFGHLKTLNIDEAKIKELQAKYGL